MMSNWPIVLPDQEITLRPLRFRDRARWNLVRAENREWLTPWEATIPAVGEDSYKQLPSFLGMVKMLNFEARHGRSYSFAIWQGSSLIGQISLGGVIYGAMRGGHIGYWIDKNFANRGYTTRAVEILTQYAFEELKLHRIEINLRPENDSSRRVAEKAGFVLEGARARYLHINGQWRDHICFVRENPAIK
jgi:ribosomal-protein-alanine N-acetyltransferase